MPNVLAEQIHYNPTGMVDVLDNIRQFAVAQGWTQDVWTGGNSLQLWSPGYSVQEMCYRLKFYNHDVNTDILQFNAVVPGYRYSGTQNIDSPTENWGAINTSYANINLPATTMNAQYLYGNRLFIACILHINPIAVVTLLMGTYELFPGWRNYPGLNFYFYVQAWFNPTSVPNRAWQNINDNSIYWKWPPQDMGGTSRSYSIWYEGAKREFAHHTNNYRPTNVNNVGSEAGEFNNPKFLLRQNNFTNKRVAFQSNAFVKEPTLGVYYPIGNSPWSYINGSNLTIGEEISFGLDTYRCFPIMYSTSDIWQAYRTA